MDLKTLGTGLKGGGIRAAWIAGLILALVLLWSLTFPFRLELLRNAANRHFAASGDGRRLSKVIPGSSGGDFLGGIFAMEGSDSVLVIFTVMRDGILTPFAAEFSPDGSLLGTFPLGAHSSGIADLLAPGIIDLHLARIRARLPFGTASEKEGK
ncbi:MAG: hypothetical protein FWD94_05390 [Treponema sp.]|nr:hypothetical protein [Treponema sp.]